MSEFDRWDFSIEDLKGKVFTKIEGGKDSHCLDFYCTSGKVYRMAHEQDCCESVTIEDIVGDLDDLVGEPIVMAEEATSDVAVSPWTPTDAEVMSVLAEDNKDREEYESQTWTFYKLATIKGYVTIRWYGTSNGYYSEVADVWRIK